jgi:hypothetical protein
MKKHAKHDKVRSRRRTVKNKKQTKTSKKPLERQYEGIFTPHPLPYQGVYTDEDSLEQPSALKYVPTTSTPNIEA